jgi:hypothetical protein
MVPSWHNHLGVRQRVDDKREEKLEPDERDDDDGADAELPGEAGGGRAGVEERRGHLP